MRVHVMCVCVSVVFVLVCGYTCMWIQACDHEMCVVHAYKRSSSTFESTAPGLLHCRYIHTYDVQCSIKGQRSELACLQVQ